MTRSWHSLDVAHTDPCLGVFTILPGGGLGGGMLIDSIIVACRLVDGLIICAHCVRRNNHFVFGIALASTVR